MAGALALGIAAALLARVLGQRSVRAAVAWALAPVACAAIVSVAALLRVEHTFDPQGFASPSFYARGAERGQLLKVAETAQTAEGRYSSSVQRTLAPPWPW